MNTLQKQLVYCLIVGLLLSAGGVPLHAQDDTTDFDGNWIVQGYGIAFAVEGGQFRVLEISGDDCIEVMSGPIDGNIVHNVPLLNADITLSIDNGQIVIWLKDDEMARADRVDQLPGECDVQTGMSELLPPASEVEFSTLDDLDHLIAGWVDTVSLPGMAVALVNANGVVWSRGYGLTDLAAELPVTSDTPFLVSSDSKIVTATALMHGWEDGAFDLDADINDYLPFTVDNPRLDGETITLRELLSHTSSILDSEYYMQSYQPGDPVLDDLRTFLEGYLTPGGQWYDPEFNFAAAEPGTSWQYSNVGIALAALVLQEITGQPFDDYCASVLFEPLGMTNTHWFLADYPDVSQIASPYDRGYQPFEHFGHPTWPAGQLRSSVNDLGRFLAAIMNGGALGDVRILDEATVQVMLAPQITHLGEEYARQALGWMYDPAFGNAVGHNGSDPGATVAMFFDPTAQVGVVILINEGTAKAINLASLLLEVTVGRADVFSVLLAAQQ